LKRQEDNFSPEGCKIKGVDGLRRRDLQDIVDTYHTYSGCPKGRAQLKPNVVQIDGVKGECPDSKSGRWDSH